MSEASRLSTHRRLLTYLTAGLHNDRLGLSAAEPETRTRVVYKSAVGTSPPPAYMA